MGISSKKLFNSFKKKPIFVLISLFLLIAYILIFFRRILIYLAILFLSAYIHYRHYKGFPKINLGHIYFFAFIIDWHDGLTGEILFILLAGLLPELYVGYLEMKTFFVYALMVLFISLPIYLIHSNYVLLGIVSSIAYFTIIFIISGLTREPIPERIFEVVIPGILNVLYFMYLAQPFYSLLDFVLF